MSNVFQANTNPTQTNSREEAVLWFNPNLFGWEPKYGIAITASDISKSESLQAIVAAMTLPDGTKDLTAAQFQGISGSFRWNEKAVKPLAEGVQIVRI